MTIRSIYRAMPTRDERMTWATTEACERATHALREREIGIVRGVPLQGGLVDVARDRLLAKFLASKCDAIWFVDDDIVFPPSALLRLIDSGHAFCGGVYAKRMIHWDRVWTAQKNGAPHPEEYASEPCVRWLPGSWERSEHRIDANGFVEVEGLGFGFVLLRRDAVEHMAAAYRDDLAYRSKADDGREIVALFEPERVYRSAHRHDRFSEDLTFCRRWRAIGGEVWADGKQRFEHLGPHPFTCASLLEQLGEMEEIDGTGTDGK